MGTTSWGIGDLHGNILEWCRVWYHARLLGGTDADLRDVKGAWDDVGWACRPAFLRYEFQRRADHVGFRVDAVRP